MPFFPTQMHNLEARKNSFSSRCCRHNHSPLWQKAGDASSLMNEAQVNFMLELSQLAPAIVEGLV